MCVLQVERWNTVAVYLIQAHDAGQALGLEDLGKVEAQLVLSVVKGRR
jgi:hypothetical protein